MFAADTITPTTFLKAADMSEGPMKILWAIVWLIILLWIGWWIGFLCGWIYVLLIPFTACIPQLSEITDIFLKGEKIPFFIAKFMIEGTPITEAKLSE